MGLCHEKQGLSALCSQGPGWRATQHEGALFCRPPRLPPHLKQELPARATAGPLTRVMLTESRFTTTCLPQPQDPGRQTLSFGQG